MTGPCPDDRQTVSLAFANTPDDGYADATEAAAALRTWLVQQELVREGVEVSGSELARFVRLREAIRGILVARVVEVAPDGSAVRIVEAAALAAPGAPIGVWAADGAVTRGWRPTGGDPLDRAAAALAAGVVDVVCDHGARLVDGDGDARFVLTPA